MKQNRVIIWTVNLFFCLMCGLVNAVPVAFPGAEGSGRYAVGGRGGDVYEVTNLTNSGPGSIVDAVSSGNRTIVFRVSGIIELGDVLLRPKSNTTIAGQTAPGDGICLKGRIYIGSVSDVIIRYLRVRVDEGGANSSGDAIDIDTGHHIIIDHVSASYARDETISCQDGSDNVTVQWCIMSEALTYEGHSYGSLIRGEYGESKTYHHNLYAHNNGRNPRPGNYTSTSSDPQGILFDFRNNVVYNWAGGHPGYNADTDTTSRYNFVGNVFIQGLDSSWTAAFKESAVDAYAYWSGNGYGANYHSITVPADQWSLVSFKGFDTDEIAAYKARSYEIPMESVTTTSATVALEDVLAEAGASYPSRDIIDARIVTDVMNGTGRSISTTHEQTEGGWPTLNSLPPPADTDHDGMPDTWEIANGLNKTNPADRNNYDLHLEYTNLEVYLNSLVAYDLEAPAAPTGLTADAGNGFVELTWDDNPENDLAGYYVFRSTSSSSGFSQLNHLPLRKPDYIDYDVTNLTTYYYYVMAVNMDSIESFNSDMVSALPHDGTHLILSSADFENGFGEWMNVTEDSHDWTRNSGPTILARYRGTTGPDGGDNGSDWYVFLETLSRFGGAGQANDTAYLEGPEINGTGCKLTFYYHMFGEDIGSLRVDVFDDGIWHHSIWSLSGPQHTSISDPYTRATVDLSGYSGPIRIRIRAVAAGGDNGQIAIDDIKVIGSVAGIDPLSAQGLVDATSRHQEIEGFGAAGAWYENRLTDHPLKTEIYDILFGQLGLDIYRVRNVYDQAGDEYMSNSAQIIAAGEESLGRPLKIMISCWSPPTYLKSNDSLNRGTLKKNANGDYMYDELGQWWADSLEVWRDTYGVNADYINIQNEPDWEADWDTCRYSGTETDSLAGYDQAFEAVWQKLIYRMGLSMPRMLAAEAAGIPNSAGYLDNLLDYSHVYGYSHHLYNINSGASPDLYYNAMADFANRYGEKPLFQTEYEASTDSWPDAMNLALLLHNSLTVEGVSGYLYWDLFWADAGGLVTLDNPSSGNPNFTINSDYYGFKHYSAFIHSGWQRVETSVDSNNPRISAYISPDNQQMSVILINTDTRNDINFDLIFKGVSTDEGSIYRTSQRENCVLVGSFDSDNTLPLPAYSITTLDLSITPDYLVAEAQVEMKLKCKPANLKPNTKSTTVTAIFTTPKGIGPNDIDMSEPLTFYPGGIEALDRTIEIKGRLEKIRAKVTATFDVFECMENLQPGENTIYVVGKLMTGEYFEAAGSLKYTP
ncbi:MAG: hypothetical protein JW860_00100 [Sedimentisphaerales bacterium]|nr:hypothetical protein [Sedimentisphaerales bacterium]